MNADAFPIGLMERGQSAFAAIQEIVAQLMADPTRDWSRVDIEALRQHLIDMDNVALRARVPVEEIEGGAQFKAISEDAAVTGSIRAMVPAHAATMVGVEGWTMQAAEIPGGAALVVTGADPERIRALGFIGVMTVACTNKPITSRWRPVTIHTRIDVREEHRGFGARFVGSDFSASDHRRIKRRTIRD